MNRQKLLEAAARVYAEGGFRGATTRRIAEEAGVNEVTLFRLFGSKAHLISEAIQCMDPMGTVALPSTPSDPQRELGDWCRGHANAMRAWRSVIRKTLADLEEHPEMQPFICDGQTVHFSMLVNYAMKLVPNASEADREDVVTACTMLFSALFSDSMARDVAPAVYPSPEEEAADRYVRVFLRALGVAVHVPDASPASDAEPATVGRN
ncbi:MAG: helix-turn-helix domain-containing protein [Gemmatimonadaceae bacterium]